MPPSLALLGLGAEEIVLILLVILIFFGATKIPEIARSLGRAKGEFEKGTREGKDMLVKESANEDERVRKAAAALGIPTEGRALDEIKRDLKTRVG